MNFLALVNRARQECVSGGAPLLTLQGGLTADTQRFVSWVQTEWNELQMRRPDWMWMRKTASFTTVMGQRAYTPASDVADWKPETFRLSSAALNYADETYLTYWEYEDFRDLYLFGTQRGLTTRPDVFTVNPLDESVWLGALPAAIYRIEGDYYHTPTSLVADADSPSDPGNNLPERFHMLLVYRVMRAYASQFAAPELDERGAQGEARLNRKLELWGLPTVDVAGAFA